MLLRDAPEGGFLSSQLPQGASAALDEPFALRGRAGDKVGPTLRHRQGIRLVLLCYVESAKRSSNFRPQQWQKPIHRSNHGRILLSVCSHVTPEVFFGAQVNDRDKQIRQDGQDQVVMKPAPTAPLEVIQTQIGLSPLEILLSR